MSRQPSALPTNLWDLNENGKDDIVDEIHAWREAYAARFDNDVDRMFGDLKLKEKANSARRSDAKPLKPHRRG